MGNTRKFFLVLSMILSTAAVGTTSAGAGPGGGVAALGSCPYPTDVLSRSDGGTLVAGQILPDDNCVPDAIGAKAMVAALDRDGRLDPGFGDGGVVEVDALQPNSSRFDSAGRTLVADRQALRRIGTDGATDTSFGQAGVVDLGSPAIEIGDGDNYPPEFHTAPDGRIFLSGPLKEGDDWGIQALRADGTVDPQFNGGHALSPDFGPEEGGLFGHGFAFDGQGNVFIIFTYGSVTSARTGIMKLDSSGQLVTSYGTGGIANIAEESYPAGGLLLPFDVVEGRILDDGSLAAYGIIGRTPVMYSEPSPFRVVASADGSQAKLDGIVLRTGGFTALPEDFSIAADGSASVATRAHYSRGDDRTDPFDGDQVAVRLLPGGALDTGFGIGGQVSERIGVGSAAHAVDGTAGGGMVVAGSATPGPCDGSAGPCAPVMALSRYTAKGVLDNGFGQGGVVTLPQLVCRSVSDNPPHSYCPRAHLARPLVKARFDRRALRIKVKSRRNPERRAAWTRATVRLPRALRLKPGRLGTVTVTGSLAAREPGSGGPGRVRAPEVKYRGGRLTVIRYGGFDRSNLGIRIPRSSLRPSGSQARRARIAVILDAPSVEPSNGFDWIRLPRSR